MDGEEDFEAKQLENVKRNHALLEELGIKRQVKEITRPSRNLPLAKKRTAEKRRVQVAPTRTSARIASKSVRPTYKENSPFPSNRDVHLRNKNRTSTRSTAIKDEAETSMEDVVHPANADGLLASLSGWAPSAPAPSRDETGFFHFESHPDFTPNKSPEEVIREGSFGGSYFRPLSSRTLGVTVSGDWEELPAAWTVGLNVSQYLASPHYDPDINKFKVRCGQSIEEWEAAGWINHDYDVRGWFQWYCRYFLGRRCPDDERQVSRWKKCVGRTGRWRRMLLKKYVSAGVRDVFDDGEEEGKEVSPVVHQTCHHWAYCVTQDDLDEFWDGGR